MEYRMVRADGQIIWVRDSGQVRMDPDGQRWVVYGVVSDITERKEAEETLAQARDQALEASRLKTQFLATVSHELRTPLNAILGFSEMLQTGVYGPLSDKQVSTTKKILGSATDLTLLVNDILDQAYLETGKLELSVCRLAPSDLITRLKSTMSALAESKGLQLTATIGDTMPDTVQGDPNRLYQILTNLTGNAIKFTKQGQVEICFFRSDENHWAMQITDTGPGIPAEAQEFIFDAFRQLDSSTTRRYGGSGLGLSITKRLVTLMGGQITVESEPGRGSTFTVVLPLAYDP
jgi:signal transduction histidine kinase